ncbi:esterase-like activity of phytase family protein [Roseobacter sp. EG26]|uniref:esterase-like activity of phytase family protein n=1 Tax=Roseobacter sp. EG26 TaxID=3412477 RepID=UPI003CE4BEA3
MTKTLLLTSTLLAGIALSPAHAEMNFNRIASFPVTANFEGDVPEETSAEIIDVSGDGLTLIYTDSPAGVIGAIDITNAHAPLPKGTLPMQGEPTAVSVIGNIAFVAVNTSESYTAPSGMIKAVDLVDMQVVQSCQLGGQPDSTARAKDGSFLAIAIENERDEDLGEGRVPQMPAGDLVLVDVADGRMDCGSMRRSGLAGLADIAGEDPEPEFVDINGLGEVVVTLQENNHIAIVARDGSVLSHFSAGAVDLEGIDATDERAALIFDERQPGRLREPDGVQWIDDDHFAIANEGDMDGGARGMTIFRKDGTLIWESGATLEQAIVQIGHYPDKRSDSKGVEPEGMEFAIYDGTPFVFVMAERASIVAVYDVTDPTAPVLHQLLPSGISPEGAVAIPERGLLVTANEFDGRQDGAAPAHVMLYEYTDRAASYPHLTSEGMETLTGWGAISGLVSDQNGMIYAVSDSFYGHQPRIFKIDPRTSPARIVEAIDVTRNGLPAQKLDMEGIALDGKGGFWIASEGRTDRLRPHAILNVSANGEIIAEIGLPPYLMAFERRFGFEGIAKVGEMLWMPVQRQWADDPKDHVKLVAYNLETEEWGAVLYSKAAAEEGWVGLSELSLYGDSVYIIERDNQHASDAVTKKIYAVPLDDLTPVALGSDLPVVSKTLVRDMIPDLKATGGYVLDKIEGLAITPEGQAWIATDNDGVDDHSGETMFFDIGNISRKALN